MYTSAGQPTASLVPDDLLLVDYKLFWVACKNTDEANYLLSIINSDALYQKVKPLMPKGLFGARDVLKHLWRLPIPEFDPAQELHTTISKAGAKAEVGAGKQLEKLRNLRGDKLTVAIARRELRKWLRESPEGKEVEDGVAELLSAGVSQSEA